MLRRFLSDALVATIGAHFHYTRKPEGAMSGQSFSSAASQRIYMLCTTDSLWTDQHLLTALYELLIFTKY